MTGGRRSADDRAAQALAARSARAFRLFCWIFERTFRSGFHAARIARASQLPAAPLRRTVIYTNHPSWWDGVAYVLLAKHQFPQHRLFTPVDAAMLEKYGFIGRIGAFGVEQGTPRGAADFMAASKAVLEVDDGLLIVAAQGRFADPRERPLRCGPGIAHLPDHISGITFVPLAIEYPLWFEKQPEMLLQFGEPIDGASLLPLPKPSRLAILEGALEQTMDRLASSSIARDESAFDVWLEGTMGVNPVYDAWRRFKALLRGRGFNAEHGGPK